MASRQYLVSDLLRMKQSPLNQELFDQMNKTLKKDCDLGEILRLPTERQLPLIEEESTDTADDSIDFHANRCSASQQLDGTGSEWKYRGRADSEHIESQPIPAPPGLAAQKDEGFQRFYKAVVSPSHVRVTAGGRIVPNTRGSHSPTAKSTKERASGDGTFSSRSSSRGQPDHGSLLHLPSTFGAYPSILPPMHPGIMNPGMAPQPAPLPVMPWPMGFNMPGMIGIPHQLSQHSQSRATPKTSVMSSKSDKQSEADVSEGRHQSAQAALLEQSPHNRPLFFNGQWTLPNGQTVYPYGLPNIPGYATPYVAPATGGQHRFNMAPTAHHQSSYASSTMSSHLGQTQSVSMQSMPGFVRSMPISSIRPSEITKRQLDSLKVTLRYLEDQLNYNKHQVDEKSMNHQAQAVRGQIEHFEKNLDAQLAYEASHYPKHDCGTDSSSSGELTNSASSAVGDARPEKPGQIRRAVSSFQGESSQMHASTAKQKMDQSLAFSKDSPANGVNLSAASLPNTFHEEHNSVGIVKRKSTLPMTAAMAPPFLPREEPFTMPSQSAPRTSVRPQVSVAEIGNVRVLQGSGDLQPYEEEMPYLVGRLPRGISSDRAKDTDYKYARDLTEDELRARHMYWGKAPRHLQKGLPRFNGKDFYPPSPGNQGSVNDASASSLSDACIPSRCNTTGSPVIDSKADTDPFQSISNSPSRLRRQAVGESTQSESLPRADSIVCGSTTRLQRHGSCATQVGRHYEDFRNAMNEGATVSASNSTKPSDECSSDEGDDDSSLLFKGRKAMSRFAGTKTRNEIWQTVLKRGKSSANVIPGTVSSMTAQGVLPHYAGHATASLTPTIANTTASPRASVTKSGMAVETGSISPIIDNRRENRPPAESMHQ